METTPQNQSIPFATFGMRTIAALIDIAVFFVPFFVILFSFLTIGGYILAQNSDWTLMDYFNGIFPLSAFFVLFTASLGILATILARFLASPWQATPGKRMMGLKVTDEKLRPITYQQAFFRSCLPMALLVLMNLPGWLSSGNHFQFDAKYEQEIVTLLPNFGNALDESPLNFTQFIYSKEGSQIFLEEVETLPEEDQKELNTIIDEMLFNYPDFKPQPKPLASLLSFVFLMLFFVWYFLVLFTKERTTLHDVIAGTRVITTPPESSTEN